jgi:hypothetical protein
VKKIMSKLIPVLLLSVSGFMITAEAHADDCWGKWLGNEHCVRHDHINAPEIDPASAISALTLLVGGMTVLRSRIRKK